MTPLRLVAIVAIFLSSTVAWMILGGTISARSGESDYRIRQEVEALWGSEHRQRPPQLAVHRTSTVRVEKETTKDDVVTRAVTIERQLSQFGTELVGTALDVRLDLAHRQKGLLWWSTYTVDLNGTYRFALPPRERTGGAVLNSDDTLLLTFPLSAQGAVYDGFVIEVDGVEHAATVADGNAFSVRVPRGMRDTVSVRVAYRSRGLGTWQYAVADRGTAQVKDFSLTLRTSDPDVNFPTGSLSPTSKADGDKTLRWTFQSLVTGQSIGVTLPERLNPGPTAARISFFAPVSLLFFMTVMVIIGVIKRRSLHPMNYFFLAAAFFAFHLLFAYLVDVMALAPAFAVSSVVSLGLVTSYLRIVQGAKAAFLQAGTAQLVFLVGFSLAFFHEGQTGLTVAVGSVVTLFILMQLTARVRWAEVFGGTDVEEGPLGGTPVGVPAFSSSTPPPPSSPAG